MVWISDTVKFAERHPAGDGKRFAPASQQAAVTLGGKCVLVVEDEMLLALDLEEGLRDLGCVVVGPAGTLRSALRLIETETVDAAILDVNLAGERVFPVARRLAEQGIPFVFATAYADAGEIYPVDVQSAPRLSKPYTVQQALQTLSALVA
jgi:CheY-like chemotaxis protein